MRFLLLLPTCLRRRPRCQIKTGQLFLGEIGVPMAKLVIHSDSKGVAAALNFKDKKGNTATPASPPVWSMSGDTALNMDVASDGLSAQFTPTGTVGNVTIDVVAEGDAQPGVDTVHLNGEIDILAAEIATGDLSFTENA